MAAAFLGSTALRVVRAVSVEKQRCEVCDRVVGLRYVLESREAFDMPALRRIVGGRK